jgi:hypothetical protein
MLICCSFFAYNIKICLRSITYPVPVLCKFHVRIGNVGFIYMYIYSQNGFGGLEVACWPLVPKFAGSNPAEAVGFLRAKKSSARLPSEGK